MSSQHAEEDSALTVRVPTDMLGSARSQLAERDIQMRGFVSACLSAFTADPNRFLPHLAGHWPPEKPRGRPVKTVRDQPRGDSAD